MRILVCEYLCSGALADHPQATSLHTEGLAMLSAIVTDLSRCPDVELLAPLDAGLRYDWPVNLTIEPVAGPTQERAVFDRLLRQVDAALVIAPEFDDLLWQRRRMVEQRGVLLLGPSSDAVRLAGDKLLLSRVWLQAGIPTPECLPLPSQVPPGPLFPSVLKPRHGAGSQATFLVTDRPALDSVLAQPGLDDWRGGFVLQPFVPGRPASVMLMIGPNDVTALPAAWQQLSNEGRFLYQGGEVPIPVAFNQRAQELARRAVAVVPGLCGLVGVDLILGERDVVIEINPRLTTSYVGLRAGASISPRHSWPGWGWRNRSPKKHGKPARSASVPMARSCLQRRNSGR